MSLSIDSAPASQNQATRWLKLPRIFSPRETGFQGHLLMSSTILPPSSQANRPVLRLGGHCPTFPPRTPAKGPGRGGGPPAGTRVHGGGAQVRGLFLPAPLNSHCFHGDGLAKQPAWTRTSEGLQAPLTVLLKFLVSRRSSVGRNFPKGQQAVLEIAPNCNAWDGGVRRTLGEVKILLGSLL